MKRRYSSVFIFSRYTFERMVPHSELLYLAQYGYLAVFCIILGSELFSFLPVGVLLIATGALAHAGYYNLVFLLIVSTLGATVSDYIVFTIARRLGSHDAYRRYVDGNRFAGAIESYMSRFPILTIAASRFIGITTSATNAIAGLSQVSRTTFILADAFGNAVCCLIYLFIGYYLGVAFEADARITAIALGLVAALIIGVLILFHFISRKQT